MPRGHHKVVLEEADISIIKELQIDSRQSLRSLAGKVGLSTPTVASRVQLLIDSGAIRSFTVNIDSSAFGLRDFVVEIVVQPKFQRGIIGAVPELQHALLTQDSRLVGIYSGSDRDAAILYEKMCGLKGAVSVSLTPAVEYRVNQSSPVIESGIKLSSGCYYCRGELGSSPVVEKIGGRRRFFCCTSCSTLYRQRYAELEKGL